MSETPVLVSLDAQGRVNQDAACINCSYNLRGVAVEGNCPECGTSVRDSVGEQLLRFSRPAWVAQLASGAGWLFAGMLLSVLNCKLGEEFTALILPSIAWVMIGLGLYRLTEPEPGRTLPAYESVRGWARLSVAAVPLLAVLSWIGLLGDDTSVITGLIRTVLFVLVLWAMGCFGQVLALRLGEGRQAAQSLLVTRALMALHLVSSGAALVARALMTPAKTGRGPVVTIAGGTYPGNAALSAVVIVLVLGFVVFGIWSLVLVFRFHKRLRAAADRAAIDAPGV